MDIKQQIIDRVNAIQNPTILREIYNLIVAEAEMEEVYRFTKAERGNVEEGLEDAKSGRSYSNEEAQKLISEWLEEKSSGQ